ncbi:MAG: fructose-bisphosphate aldolase [Candidatus Latescibacteria bacterium]|nr:fructose-bisphosphate aldolase [Candidatus Latescibacterota bacterium]
MMEDTVRRPRLDEMALSTGKKTRLHRLLYDHGPGNGTMLLLPIDQGLEHGPVDFFTNPQSADPEYQFRLAKEGGYSGIALHIGLAEKYLHAYAGEVPLVLKINGKTAIPSDRMAFSAQTATVEDAVRLGADAIGYTLYAGSPAQADDINQFMRVRADAERFGMPIIVWAYPRGEAVEAKGGRDGLYAIDYAARVATELGADVVKLNVPEYDDEKMKQSPKPYNTLKLNHLDTMRKVVASAGNQTMVLVSGGSKISDDDLLEKARISMEGGATGLIFGRNMWQREFHDALEITARIKDIMRQVS